MTNRQILVALAAACCFGLCACAPAAQNSAPTSSATDSVRTSPTAPPSPSFPANQNYVTLVELRDAAVAAGYPCPKWSQDDKVANASASGSCSAGDVFSLYANGSQLQAQIKQSLRNNKELTDAGLTPDPTLVGPNWMISMPAQYLNQLRTKLGGTDLELLPQASDSPAVTFNAEPSDFTIGIKIREKQCFGSAGCNITYRINPSYTGTEPLPDTGVIEISYTVTGDESGPIQNTFTIDGEGAARFDKEESASTKANSVKLKAKATDVSYDPAATAGE